MMDGITVNCHQTKRNHLKHHTFNYKELACYVID